MKLDKYLTESLLADVLVAWAGAENVTQQSYVTGTRMKWDFEVKRDNRIIVVEFDGDSHFRDANVIMRDNIKDAIAISENKKIVRIPYFVQLDKQMFKEWFGEDFDIETTFPHGFITTKILPASFCPYGYARAMHFMQVAPKEVSNAIRVSLEEKAKKLEERYVYFTVDYGTEDEPMTWAEFIKEARRIHGDKYEYYRNL